MKELLVLRDLESIKVITHPRRIDILKSFQKEPLSAKQLSQILDEPHAKINYHIKALYKVGILELVEEKVKSGIVEKYYYPMAKNIIMDKKIINYSLDKLFEDISDNEYISKFENISETFYKAAEDEQLDIDNVVAYQGVSFTHSEIKEINETIKIKIDEILNRKSEIHNDKKYNLSIVSIPICENEVYNL